jgi:hypothetical protein
MKREGSKNQRRCKGKGNGGKRNEVEILASIGPRGVMEGVFNERKNTTLLELDWNSLHMDKDPGVDNLCNHQSSLINIAYD